MSKVYHLQFSQFIPATIKETWRFFSAPENLPKITPPEMNFKILSSPSQKVYAGQIIEYNVSVLPGISLYWMTEITNVMEEVYFVDEQRFGPYSLWHHQHHFKPEKDGVMMTDIIHYKIPFWIFGDFANKLFVKKQLIKIFQHRTQMVNELFTLPHNEL